MQTHPARRSGPGQAGNLAQFPGFERNNGTEGTLKKLDFPMILRRTLGLFTVIFMLALLAACASKPGSTQPVPTSNLSPYATRTPPTLPQTATPPASPTAAPTSTPLIYTIVRNDTLSSIARHFGVSIEALLAANPGVIPQALSIGQTLTIPPAGQGPASASISTPIPLDQIGRAHV